MKKFFFWFFAVVITLGSAVYLVILVQKQANCGTPYLTIAETKSSKFTLSCA